MSKVSGDSAAGIQPHRQTDSGQRAVAQCKTEKVQLFSIKENVCHPRLLPEEEKKQVVVIQLGGLIHKE